MTFSQHKACRFTHHVFTCARQIDSIIHRSSNVNKDHLLVQRNLDSGMKVCSGSDSILNRGVGVFRSHVQNMNIGPTTNQITDVYETLFSWRVEYCGDVVISHGQYITSFQLRATELTFCSTLQYLSTVPRSPVRFLLLFCSS